LLKNIPKDNQALNLDFSKFWDATITRKEVNFGKPKPV